MRQNNYSYNYRFPKLTLKKLLYNYIIIIKYKVHKGIMSHLSMEFNYELREGH